MNDPRELKDLISSAGWEQLKERLELRRQSALKNLVTAQDYLSCARYQAQIKEIEALIQFPHEMIQEYKRKEDHNGR